MRTRTVLVTLSLLTLTACDYRMEPQDAAAYNTRNLCTLYSAPYGMNRDNPVVAAELAKRGETRCTRPDIAANQRGNTIATALFGPLGGFVHSAVSPDPD